MDETPQNGTPEGGKSPPRAKPTKERWWADRPGGRPGNKNALRHGMRGGKLPDGCQHIENAVNSLRRQMEDALIAVKGEIDVVDAAAINSILKWERHGLLAQHWLRKEAVTMSAADRLRFSEAIAKASDNRDKNIRLLGLSIQKQSPWMIDVTPLALPTPAPSDDADVEADPRTLDTNNHDLRDK